MNNIETLLKDEIKTEFETLKEMELGTDEYKTAVDGLTKLVDRAIELKKVDSDNDLKIKQASEEQKDRLIKNGISVAGIVIPVLVTIWGTKASFQFEKEGTVTTIMGRGFIQKLLPKK